VNQALAVAVNLATEYACQLFEPEGQCDDLSAWVPRPGNAWSAP
jgi:hypothetical protein